jgi:fructose/tagatose bisphosphate aldolase
MLDGSRLPLAENIAATKTVVGMAHPAVAVEGELGAVLGHEHSPLPPYEEIMAAGYGFTDPGDVERFVRETGVDWLSVAAGNIHGAVAGVASDEEKVGTRLDLDHIQRLSECAKIPFVLHGGTRIDLDCVRQAAACSITKVNVGTAVRQPYEAALRRGESETEAQRAVAEAVARCIAEYDIAGSASRLASDTGLVALPPRTGPGDMLGFRDLDGIWRSKADEREATHAGTDEGAGDGERPVEEAGGGSVVG